MSYETFFESAAANLLLIFGYLAYKFLARVAGSKCHYTRDHGLELHLPDPDEHSSVPQINDFLANSGLSMRIRQAPGASVV